VVIRLKVPIEMHYAVIPMGTSKVNSSPKRVVNLKTLYPLWLLKTHHLIISRSVQINFGVIKKFCIILSTILGNRNWKLLVVLFYRSYIINVGMASSVCAYSDDTIR